ncbi:PspA/IM30 family protein [Methylomonas methanica]|uniref:PspA/IM30 family protein n=1 Tax=Methylomonas methanica (strain DSM 25384 / MC09) TaxID=857087 RepID=F9ZX91_METMM|nr:PspA/IM30 family protein [Methylomonas methanica]AEF99701.1 PspA/IM30 family protein [Methylomonas methanica MC09]
MNSLKRIFVSIKSQIDHVADEFENHEALARAAIEDLLTLQQKTRLHLHRVTKLTGNYQQKIDQEREQARLWSDRAVKVRSQDEAKALQCVKRLRASQQQIALLEQQLAQTSSQESKIRNDLQTIEAQLLILKNKKEILSARQNRNSLQDALQDGQSSSLREAQNIFERWEGNVAMAETESFSLAEYDNLAQAFEQEEDELSLRLLLDELSQQAATNDQ